MSQENNSYQDPLTLPTQELQTAIQIIGNYANKNSHEMQFSLSENKIQIEAEDPDFSNKGEINLPCNYQGKAMRIRVNYRLFLEMVKNIPGDNLVLHLDKP